VVKALAEAMGGSAGGDSAPAAATSRTPATVSPKAMLDLLGVTLDTDEA